MQTCAIRINVIQSRKITENIALSKHMPHVTEEKGKLQIVEFVNSNKSVR